MKRTFSRLTLTMTAITRVAVAVIVGTAVPVQSQPGGGPGGAETAAWRDGFAQRVEMDKLQRRARNGSAAAQAHLGILYAEGDGVPVDYDTAADWFQQAADQGHPIARHYLATLYEVGVGVPRDRAKAARLWRSLARQGFPVAQYKISVAYEKGDGVPRDPVKAYAWATVAEDSAHQAAAANVKWLLEREMNSDQVAEAKTLARALQRVIAEKRADRSVDQS